MLWSSEANLEMKSFFLEGHTFAGSFILPGFNLRIEAL